MPDSSNLPQVLASLWRIEVLAGSNAGAGVDLSPGIHRIGREHDNDIVLADDRMAAHQACLRIEGEKAWVTAHAVGVLRPGRFRPQRLPVGRQTELYDGAILTLGASHARFSGPTPRPQALRRATYLAAGLATFLAGAALAAGTGRVAIPDGMISQLGHAAAPPSAAVELAGPNHLDAAQAAGELQQRVAAVGLGSLRLECQDGAIVAHGFLTTSQRDRWLVAQRWFDERSLGKLILIDRTEQQAELLPPRLTIQGVSIGRTRFVIAANGHRYTEGAVLDDGWVLTGITEQWLTLSKGGQDARINL